MTTKPEFTKSEVARVCLLYGALLDVVGCADTAGAPLDGAQLLWALAGCESRFGANCTPRHEPGYCDKTNGFYWRRAKLDTLKSGQKHRLILLTEQFECDAHKSYGPWQIMHVNAFAWKPEEFRSVETCALATVAFLNKEILQKQRARTLEQIADAYNSGNFRDDNKPVDYIVKLKQYYATEVIG